MAKDIEEFLKMAAKRRQQQKQQGGGAAARNRPASPPPAQPPRQAPASRPPVRPATDDEIQVIGGTAEEVDPYRQSVSDHVKSHIDTSSLVQHAELLGEEVGLADDKLEARLHQKFDHDVGQLNLEKPRMQTDSSPGTVAKPVSRLAVDLVKMLNNPVNVRQAILISEVLKRPDFD